MTGGGLHLLVFVLVPLATIVMGAAVIEWRDDRRRTGRLLAMVGDRERRCACDCRCRVRVVPRVIDPASVLCYRCRMTGGHDRADRA